MRIAIVSDIHSNYEALSRVMEWITLHETDRIYCLGDIVGYGPYPNECIELIKKSCHGVVAGNHDVAVAKKISLRNFTVPGRKVIKWTREKISDVNRQFLADLPFRIVEDGITFVHSSPLAETEWNYLRSWSEVEKAFQGFTTRICFVGHSHIPFIAGDDGSVGKFDMSSRMIINVGSVGQPRTGTPDAVFGFLDTELWTYESIRVAYDVNITATAIHEVPLPGMLAQRLLNGY